MDRESDQPLMTPGLRFAITVVVMSASLMQVLDTTIANVALPHMQASLNATQESVAWVLTSYIVASAIATPVTGWLEARFGRRNLFLVAISGFTLSSMACGLAPSLTAMVVARLFQGIFGAFIAPLAQAVMLDIYPRSQRALAMTIWGMGVMIGPIIGPVLGGYITDNLTWRWVFFINVPIGALASFGAWALLRSGPRSERPFDVTGFVLLGLALAAFQLALDRGTQLDWLDSVEIWIEIGVALAAIWMFVVHSATTAHPLIPLALFRDRNLMLANLFLLVSAGIMMAGAALIAPMLQRMMGYGVVDAGMMMMPRGVAMMISMILAGRLVAKVDPRILIGGGLGICAVSQFMMTDFNLQMGPWLVVLSGFIQGLGFGLVILPLNLLAFATLAPKMVTEGAALYSLSRNIGGSIAISVTTALVARNLQVSHSDLSVHVTTVSLPFIESGMIERLGLHAQQLMLMIDAEVNRQALMIAYLDDFWLMAWAAVFVAPLALFMSAARPRKDAPPISE